MFVRLTQGVSPYYLNSHWNPVLCIYGRESVFLTPSPPRPYSFLVAMVKQEIGQTNHRGTEPQRKTSFAAETCGQPFHSYHHVGLGHFDHPMKMVGHQTIRMDLSACFFTGLPQAVQQAPPILLIGENRLASVPRFMT
ncbi:MAG: hypothetical protein QOF48_899 [Verrucomicrobiota bacterium]|jgi:hypothetical protein